MPKAESIKIRWYFDACVLDESLYEEILKSACEKPQHPIVIVLSHLALGEALGNIFDKGGGGKLDKFVKFLDALRKNGYVEIVENDHKVEEVYNKVYRCLRPGNFADAIHVSTAILNGCTHFYSADPDIVGLSRENKQRIQKIAKGFKIEDFCIVKKDLKK